MINILDLQDNTVDRVFIFGNINGRYEKFIDILYYQNYSNNDIIISTGNLIDPESDYSLDLIEFFRNTDVSYCVYGHNEHQLVMTLKEDFNSSAPLWLKNYPNPSLIIKYLSNLPEMIHLSDDIFVVNSGIEPGIDLKKQKEDVFYSIGNYDENSRFYTFINPDKKSWYEFDHNCKIIFSGIETEKDSYNSCFSLNSSDRLKCMIFKKDYFEPIIVEG
jgi:hypothetical protein